MKRTMLPLGEAEMEVLQHVWGLQQATVAQVHERILQERKVAYTTVMTIMKKLADKGYLRYEQEGVAYVYSAARPPEQVRGNVLRALIERVFRGSPTALVHTLVQQEELSDAEYDEIRGLLDGLGAAAKPEDTP